MKPLLKIAAAVTVVLALCNPMRVEAAVTFDNDGKPMDEPYGDSGVEPTYEGVEYYDCYIPYTLTYEEVGGYATGVVWYQYETYNTPNGMAESVRQQKVGTAFMRENDVLNSYVMGSCSVKRDEETGMRVYVDANGNEYYSCAVPHFMYNNEFAGTNGFSEYSLSNRGQILDVILSDGTVIHFIIGDAAAIQHSNAGSDDPAARFDVEYVFSDINYSQYRHMFHAVSGHFIELNGNTNCLSGFMNKYNIGDGDGQNHVVYVRMYNQKVQENPPERTSSAGNGVDHSLGEVKIDSSGSSSSGESSGDGIARVDEYELDGMKGLDSHISNSQDQLEFAERTDLNIGEQYAVATLGDNIELIEYASALDLARTIVVFIGLVILFYAVLIFMCMLLDRVNSFIDVNFVRLVTFGGLTYSIDEDNKGRKGYASTGKLILILFIMGTVGGLLITGGVWPVLMKVLMFIVDFVTGR